MGREDETADKRALSDRLRPRGRRHRRADRRAALHARAVRGAAARIPHTARRRRHLPAGEVERRRITSCTPSASRQRGNRGERVNAAGRVVAVGTTVTRVLEHHRQRTARLIEEDQRGETDIFIYPPYDFGVVGGLLTNFHLPKSTLIMLVSAFAGRELVMEAYREAVRERYRFYSYGDCMLLV